MLTREGLGRVIEECEDFGFQRLMLEDTDVALWPEDCTVPALVFEREELEYFASPFNIADVLDIVWSACANGLN